MSTTVYDSHGNAVEVDPWALQGYLDRGFTTSPPQGTGSRRGRPRPLTSSQLAAQERANAIAPSGVAGPDPLLETLTSDAFLDKMNQIRDSIEREMARSRGDLENPQLLPLRFLGYDQDGKPLFKATLVGAGRGGIGGALTGFFSGSGDPYSKVYSLGFREGEPFMQNFIEQTIPGPADMGDFNPTGDLDVAAQQIWDDYQNGLITQGEVVRQLQSQLGLSRHEAETWAYGTTINATGRIPKWSTGWQLPIPGSLDEWDAFSLMMADMRAAAGGRGGANAPVYRGPDEGLLGDSIKAMLVKMVGRSDLGRISALSQLYLQDDRRAFDGASVDPGQSVREAIRTYADYQVIHALRPEMVNEDEWITKQFTGLMNAGVRTGALADRAIVQAQVGVQAMRAGAAGALSEFEQTGRPIPQFFERIRNAARTTFAGVR